jgi:hypothetical protein
MMATYPDDSAKTGVWRVMPVDDFPAWLTAQSRVPTSVRYIVDHHTWSPSSASQSPSGFLAQVKGIFRNYYEPVRGWKRDHGPQLHLGIIGGKAYLVIAANLHVHGPHCAYFNACSVGIETYTNGDKAPWSEEMLRGLYVIHAAFRDRLGIPLACGVNGSTNTNVPTKTGTGFLFHRDAKNANKSCPGWKNTHTLLQAAFDRFEEDDMFDDEARTDLRELRHGSAVKQSIVMAINNALAIEWWEEAKRLNDIFYSRWPRTAVVNRETVIVNTSGLPEDWAPPK